MSGMLHELNLSTLQQCYQKATLLIATKSLIPAHPDFTDHQHSFIHLSGRSNVYMNCFFPRIIKLHILPASIIMTGFGKTDHNGNVSLSYKQLNGRKAYFTHWFYTWLVVHRLVIIIQLSTKNNKLQSKSDVKTGHI